MSRTRLFGKLRRIAARALAERESPGRSVDARTALLTRRQLTFGAAAQLGAMSALAACSGDDASRRRGGERVAVIGAGIAGLHCAYRLYQAGVEVTVYEAASRVGGRMFSVRDEDYDGQSFELGGELIDSNHVTMLALAEELEIELDDRLSDQSIQADVWFVGGAEIPEAKIVEQFAAVAPVMAEAVAAADDEDDDTAFVALDQTALSDWLDEHVPSAEYPELYAILSSAYRGEFGLETDQQSALNLLYLVGSDDPDPFRIFGESDERYHAHEGSEQFPLRLANRLTEDGHAKHRLVLETKLLAVRGGDARGFTLELLDSETGARQEATFDHVVLAIPFSVLRKLTLDVPLSDLKRQIIDELGYGTNAKVMGSFASRLWRERHGKSGAVTSDLALQQTWDTSIGQPGDRGILTNFLGGQAGLEVGDEDPESYYTGMLADLEQIFPGVTEAYYENSARLMHWPSYEHTLGSYTCYRPGQWSFWGLEGTREGNLHFCGEHTSADFQGWMEGGAESGALVAAEILEDLAIAPAPEHAALLSVKTVVPQPAFRGGGGRRLGYRQRHRLLAARPANSAAARRLR
jgi:monoamine oxidase